MPGCLCVNIPALFPPGSEALELGRSWDFHPPKTLLGKCTNKREEESHGAELGAWDEPKSGNLAPLGPLWPSERNNSNLERSGAQL